MRQEDNLQLQNFIAAGKSKGAADEFLAALLTRPGWSAPDVYTALGQYWAHATGLSVPERVGAGESARDAFLYLLSFATVATSRSHVYDLRSVATWQMACVAVAFPICLLVVTAQSDTASITGVVRDSSTASIPGASVVVKNEATGIERRAKTSETGLFIVSNLPPGFYTISVEAQGFKKSETTKNKLDPNIATSVDVSMQIGSATETVNVEASTVLDALWSGICGPTR